MTRDYYNLLKDILEVLEDIRFELREINRSDE